MDERRKPTRGDLEAARGGRIPDILGPGLRLVFCGINPSLYSAVVGHHFARPGNRFWPALHAGGFTERLLSPYEDQSLRTLGMGLTNLVSRATAAADELDPDEQCRGGRSLRRKIRRYRPAWMAVLGVTAYRIAFGNPQAILGPQAERIGDTRLWVLPSPSGLNAHYRLADLARLFAELREQVFE